MKPSQLATSLAADQLFPAFAKEKLRREVMRYPGDLRTRQDKNSELIRFVCSVKTLDELDKSESAACVFDAVIYQKFLEYKNNAS